MVTGFLAICGLVFFVASVSPLTPTVKRHVSDDGNFITSTELPMPMGSRLIAMTGFLFAVFCILKVNYW